MDGLVGKTLGQFFPKGTTHAQAVTALQAQHSPLATSFPPPAPSPVSAWTSGRWEWSLLGLIALYLMATFFSWVSWYVMAAFHSGPSIGSAATST